MHLDSERPSADAGGGGGWRWFAPFRKLKNWMLRLEEALETTEIDVLNRRITALIEEVAQLREELAEFKAQQTKHGSGKAEAAST